MGKTLAELKRELEKERNITAAKMEIAGIGRQKAEIQKQIKAEKRKRKFGSSISVSKRIARGLGKRLSIGGRSIVKAAQAVEAAEKKRQQRERAEQREIARGKKISQRRATTTRRRKRRAVASANSARRSF